MKIAIVFIILSIGIAAIMLSNYKIKFVVKIKGKDSYFSIEISTLKGLMRYKYEIPFMDLVFQGDKPLIKMVIDKADKYSHTKNEEKLNLNEIKYLFNVAERYKKIYEDTIDYILEKMKIKDFNLDIKIGLNDAATTAIIYGVSNSLIRIIMSILTRGRKFEELHVSVLPEFNKNILEINFNCIINLKLVNIIIARLKKKAINI